MPNPAVLINSIPLLEAQASSEIENIVTTTDALFRHLGDEAGADAATRETLRYRTALRVGSDLVAHGVLVEHRAGREVLFINHQFLELLAR